MQLLGRLIDSIAMSQGFVSAFDSLFFTAMVALLVIALVLSTISGFIDIVVFILLVLAAIFLTLLLADQILASAPLMTEGISGELPGLPSDWRARSF